MYRLAQATLFAASLISVSACSLTTTETVKDSSSSDATVIVDFTTCVEAGFAVMESYPRQCRDAEGNVYVEKIEEQHTSLGNDSMEEKEDSSAMQASSAPEQVQQPTGVYVEYSEGVIGNGTVSVLFFHAPWCPNCRANDERLSNWYATEEFAHSVYKIDFDSATTLRSRYGVPTQDTFILIDGEGNEIERLTFPSSDSLQALLG